MMVRSCSSRMELCFNDTVHRLPTPIVGTGTMLITTLSVGWLGLDADEGRGKLR